MSEKPSQSLHELACCPTLTDKPVCDVIDLRYVLNAQVVVRDRTVPVQYIFHYRLERCSEGLALGDLAYTTTLLPGEQVRLFSSDRHTRWSYDSTSQQTYRHETTSEESYLTWGIAKAVSDLNVSQSGSDNSASHESWASGGGGASVDLLVVQVGGGGGGGSYDASSAHDFNRNLSQHAASASSQVAAGVRAASATAIGEAQQRTHAEGESEERIESASRTFKNPNRCHALTYLFYRLMKRQRIRFHLVAIERVIDDPAAPTLVDKRPQNDVAGAVSVRPQRIFATAANRLEIERMARTAAAEQARAQEAGGAQGNLRLAARPMDADLRAAALQQATQDLAKAGMVNAANGKPTDKLIAELSWEREELLPTPGVIVKGCLDTCETCEPTLEREIELELEHKELRNKLLAKQIDLLEKSQEYRCCPAGDDDDDD
jgi:hypothetical protein